MKIWVKPIVKVANLLGMSKMVPKALTIESSLYASGCHKGMN